MQLTATQRTSYNIKALVLVLLGLVALTWLVDNALPYQLSATEWQTYFFHRDDSDYRQLILHFTFSLAYRWRCYVAPRWRLRDA